MIGKKQYFKEGDYVRYVGCVYNHIVGNKVGQVVKALGNGADGWYRVAWAIPVEALTSCYEVYDVVTATEEEYVIERLAWLGEMNHV
jgi:hypothetical protein